MLNRSASLLMSTSVLKALPGKLDIKRHLPSILYILTCFLKTCCCPAVGESSRTYNTKVHRSKHHIYINDG